MKRFPFACAFLVACLPTGTGNPLTDAAPAFDGGVPGSDAAPSPSDAAASDAAYNDVGPGADASCVDAGLAGCGSEPQLGCDCLSGPPALVGSGAPLALVDHDAEDGRSTMIRFRRDEAGSGDLDSVVLRDGVVESETVIVRRADRAGPVVASIGAKLVVAWVESRTTLMMAEVNIATNEVSTPARI